MSYNPNIHHRRSIRLKGYDYSRPGAYFATVCVQGRECLLGNVVNGEMQLNEYGKIVVECWDDLLTHYPCVELDAFVVMPNHVHGIIVLNDDTVAVGAGLRPAPTQHDTTRPAPTTPLSEIVRAFKSFSARRINALRGISGAPVWQRNYYEHIIRSNADLKRIRDYIVNNPAQWDLDQLHPAHPSKW